MGFFSNVVHAVSAPIQAAVQVAAPIVNKVPIVGTVVSKVNDTAASVTTNVGTALDNVGNRLGDTVTDLANLRIASAAKNLGGAYLGASVGAYQTISGGQLSKTLSGVPLIGGAASNYYSSAGAISSGDTSTDNYKTFAIADAELAATAYSFGAAAGALGGASGGATAAVDAGTGATADAGLFGTSITEDQAIKALPVVVGAVGAATSGGNRKPAGSSLAAGGVMGTAASTTPPLSQTEKLALAGAAAAVLFFVLRRK